MPLPLVPILFLGSSVAAAAKGLYDGMTAGMTLADLRATATARRATYDAQVAAVQADDALVTLKQTMLLQLRLEALVTVGEAARFLQKARVRARDLRADRPRETPELARWEAQAVQAQAVLSGVARSVGAGAATASAIYGAVGLLGAASTGTAIASLSGAAATSATMAWLGGGALAAGGGGMALGTAVLGGLVAGPALLVGGLVLSGKVEEARTAVAEQLAAIEIAEADLGRHAALLAGISARIGELRTATREAQQALKDMLAQAAVEREDDAFLVYQLARGLSAIIDCPVVPPADPADGTTHQERRHAHGG